MPEVAVGCRTRGRQQRGDSNLQLDLFGVQRLNYETTYPIRPDGRETLAGIPPRMVAELEATNQLHAMLLTAEEQTEMELDRMRRQLMKQGLPPQQAHDQAWEMVREKYIFLPPET
jgi:hypothetical protein